MYMHVHVHAYISNYGGCSETTGLWLQSAFSNSLRIGKRGWHYHDDVSTFSFIHLWCTSLRVSLQTGWPIEHVSLWIYNSHELSNPQQLKLSWMLVFCSVLRLRHAAPRMLTRTFLGTASVAADTPNRMKPVRPNTIMYYHGSQGDWTHLLSECTGTHTYMHM